tara:strand:- start:23024 stop:26449 length:3426 start_codon:yes stop_codon:yes gene_type:complete
MATYIPGVKDYIPKLEPFTPNYKFLQDVLTVRQDRYTNNFKALNNLYNQVVNADLSIEENRNTRDQYANNLSEKLQQVSGKDLSLQANVEQAKALFKPFYEDDQLLYDMGYTSSVKKQMQEAEKLQHSDDPKVREKYWQKGMQRLQWHLEDFSKSTPEASMSMPIPNYIPYVNVVDLGIEKLKEWTGDKDIGGFEMTDQGLEIYTTNGTAITNKIVGYERDENGKKIEVNGEYVPITKNIAADYLNQTLLDDPRVQNMYATSAYVDGRTFWSNPVNTETYGGEENAKKWWLQNELKKSVDSQIRALVEYDNEIKDIEGDVKSWKRYMNKNGIVPGTAEHQYYQGIVDQLDLLERTKRRTGERVMELKSPAEDMAQLEGLAYKAVAMSAISHDIEKASQRFADIGSKTEVKFNEREKLLLQHDIKMAEIAAEAFYREDLAKKKGEIGGGAGGQFINPFSGPDVEAFSQPEIDWENFDPNDPDSEFLDNYRYNNKQDQALSSLVEANAGYMLDAIYDIYNNKSTGFAEKHNKSGEPGKITYSYQENILKEIVEMTGPSAMEQAGTYSYKLTQGKSEAEMEEMRAPTAQTVTVNTLVDETISSNFDEFRRVMSLPENYEHLSAMYSNIFSDTSLYDSQTVIDANGQEQTAYVWKNQETADDVLFNSSLLKHQLNIQGSNALAHIAGGELSKSRLELSNMVGTYFGSFKDMIPTDMYKDEYALLTDSAGVNSQVSWNMLMQKRKEDSKKGIDFAKKEIKNLTKKEYTDLYVHYYKNVLAAGLEDMQEVDWEKYPYYTKKNGKVSFNEKKAGQDAEQVYNDLKWHQDKLAMDPSNTAEAFDVSSLIAGQDQMGTGASSGYVYNYNYDFDGMVTGDPMTLASMPHIEDLRRVLSMGPGNYIAKIGTKDYILDPDAEEGEPGYMGNDLEALDILEIWGDELKRTPLKLKDPERAQFEIKVVPDGAGGSNIKEGYIAYELSWDKKDAERLFRQGEVTSDDKKEGAVNQGSEFWNQNSLVVFVAEDLSNNPLKGSNQPLDYINAIINHKGYATFTVPQGGQVTYRKGNQGRILVDQRTWNFDAETGNIVLSNDYTEQAGVSSRELNAHLNYQLQIFQGFANTNIANKNNWKKTEIKQLGGQVQQQQIPMR